VDDITHVIHYRLPDDADVYTHRSGRTARAGKSGLSVTLINTKETSRVRELERRGNIKIELSRIPDGRAICEKQLFSMLDRIVRTDVNNEDIKEYLPAVHEALEGFNKEELIKRFVSAEFNRFLEYYHESDDINVKPNQKSAKSSAPEKKKDRNRRSSRRADEMNDKAVQKSATPSFPEKKKKNSKKNSRYADDNYMTDLDTVFSLPENRKNGSKKRRTQLFSINVGRSNKINEGAIIRLICDKSGIRSNMIGRIDLNRTSSFFEVEQNAAEMLEGFFNNATLDGRPVQVRKVFKKTKHRKGERRA